MGRTYPRTMSCTSTSYLTRKFRCITLTRRFITSILALSRSMSLVGAEAPLDEDAEGGVMGDVAET